MIRDGAATGSGEWALRGRRVAARDGVRPAAVLMRGETIEAVVGPDEIPAGWPTVEAGDKLVLPGLVEIHAHINEPGRTEWEGFATATKAAAAGGITTLIDMPLNSSPVTTTVSALSRKRREAAMGQLRVDVGFHAGIVPGNADQVEGLIVGGVCAFKAFLCHSGIDEFPNSTEADLRQVMPKLAKAKIPLFVHAELVAPLPSEVETAFAAQPTRYARWLAMRPEEWEVRAIRLLIDLCREYRGAVHVVHLAAARQARALIANAKAEGLPLTVETCPHYLFFAAEEVPDGDPLFKCAPPIRGAADREALREMVRRREIDSIGSDHSPCPPEMKHLDSGDIRQAWGGISSLQLLLPIINTVFGSLDEVYDRLTRRPAEIAGLADRKGVVAPGHDADFAIVNADAEFVVTPEMLHHRHKQTPYLGQRLKGVVEATYLRGRKIYECGQFLGEPAGQLLRRATT